MKTKDKIEIVLAIILFIINIVLFFIYFPNLFSKSDFSFRDELRRESNYITNYEKLPYYNFFYIKKEDLRNKLTFWYLSKNLNWNYRHLNNTIMLFEDDSKSSLASTLMHEEIHAYDMNNSNILSKNIKNLLIEANNYLKNNNMEVCDRYFFCFYKDWKEVSIKEFKKYNKKVFDYITLVNEANLLKQESWEIYNFDDEDEFYSELAAFYYETISLYYKTWLLDLKKLNETYEWLIKLN